ncbi:MAG: hypothetical protein IJT18_06765 [Oscillospiraceae bacterium]|nr:hypothetical protein [Oscillospiraceae bacterium]
MQNDTIRLLGECDAGIQMAVKAIDDVTPSVDSRHMLHCLVKSRAAHLQLQCEAHTRLRQLGATGKAPNPMASAMSHLKTGARLAVQPDDSTVADLVIGGCNMGVKSLHKYRNRCLDADGDSRRIAGALIDLETELAQELYPYL